MTMCAQIEFAWSKRVAKPTMQEHDCAVRLTFFLDMDDRWHLKVHGLIDQGEFRVPLNHTVRGGFREPEHSTCTCILHTLVRAFWSPKEENEESTLGWAHFQGGRSQSDLELAVALTPACLRSPSLPGSAHCGEGRAPGCWCKLSSCTRGPQQGRSTSGVALRLQGLHFKGCTSRVALQGLHSMVTFIFPSIFVLFLDCKQKITCGASRVA